MDTINLSLQRRNHDIRLVEGLPCRKNAQVFISFIYRNTYITAYIEDEINQLERRTVCRKLLHYAKDRLENS